MRVGQGSPRQSVKIDLLQGQKRPTRQSVDEQDSPLQSVDKSRDASPSVKRDPLQGQKRPTRQSVDESPRTSVTSRLSPRRSRGDEATGGGNEDKVLIKVTYTLATH